MGWRTTYHRRSLKSLLTRKIDVIRLHKSEPAPEIVAELAGRTERFLELSAAGEPIPESLARGYSTPLIKTLLRQETADKCAYCESKVSHIDYGDVEHIISKDADPNLRYDFSNLTYACSICNNRKRNYHDEELPLLNPYVDDPSDHLHAAGPMVLGNAGSERGYVTAGQLRLNRSELIQRRAERIDRVQILVRAWETATSAGSRQVIQNQIWLECGYDSEFSFVVSAYLRSRGLQLPA